MLNYFEINHPDCDMRKKQFLYHMLIRHHYTVCYESNEYYEYKNPTGDTVRLDKKMLAEVKKFDDSCTIASNLGFYDYALMDTLFDEVFDLTAQVVSMKKDIDNIRSMVNIISWSTNEVH